MKLTTTKTFNASAEQLWPLLFNSKMDDNKEKETMLNRIDTAQVCDATGG